MDPDHSHCRVNKHALVPEGCPHAAPAKYIQRSIRGGDFRGFYWHGCSSYSWPCAVTGGESPVSGGPPSGTPRRSGSMWTDPESADPSGAPPKSHSLFPFSIEPRGTTPKPSVVWTMDRRLRRRPTVQTTLGWRAGHSQTCELTPVRLFLELVECHRQRAIDPVRSGSRDTWGWREWRLDHLQVCLWD